MAYKILGIDYGAKRIGLAIGLPQLKIASPWKIISYQDKNFVLEEIKRAVEEEDIKLIVVGVPYSLKEKNNLNEQLQEVKKFIKWLKEKVDIPVREFDERLSSRLARSRGSRGKVDDQAAQIILEDFLNKNY